MVSAPGVQITTTSIVIHSEELFRPPTGDVWTWCETIGGRLSQEAKAHAPPKRSFSRWGGWATGRMQAGIGATADAIGAKNIEIVCWSAAPYSKYVLKGTAHNGRRYIYTTLGWANRAVVDEWVDNRQFNFTTSERGFTMPL